MGKDELLNDEGFRLVRRTSQWRPAYQGYDVMTRNCEYLLRVAWTADDCRQRQADEYGKANDEAQDETAPERRGPDAERSAEQKTNDAGEPRGHEQACQGKLKTVTSVCCIAGSTPNQRNRSAN
jgi:hypothetical protein